jgi:hypothetical protein
VTDTTIRGSGNNGLLLNNGAQATVTRAMLSDNAGSNILVLGNGATTADIADSTVARSHDSIFAWAVTAGAAVKVSVRDSRIFGNDNTAMQAQSNAGTATLSASNNTISNNQYGIVAVLAGSTVWASGNTVSNNVKGFDNGTVYVSTPGGLFESAGDNAMRNNSVADTAGTITPALKK